MSEAKLSLDAAIKVALEEDDPDGVPNVARLRQLTGRPVKAAERDEALARLKGEPDSSNPDEAAAGRPKPDDAPVETKPSGPAQKGMVSVTAFTCLKVRGEYIGPGKVDVPPEIATEVIARGVAR